MPKKTQVNFIDPITCLPDHITTLSLLDALNAKRALMVKLNRGQFDSIQWLKVIKALEMSGFTAMAWDLRSRHDYYMAVLSG